MAYPRQYTDDQRRRAHDLFWQGRRCRPGARGKYTAAQISEMTGVSASMVYRIAQGEGLSTINEVI